MRTLTFKSLEGILKGTLNRSLKGTLEVQSLACAARSADRPASLARSWAWHEARKACVLGLGFRAL